MPHRGTVRQPDSPGGRAEADAVDQLELEGLEVVRGAVTANHNGQTRIYDGAARQEGVWMGVETKSGTAAKDANQRVFDDWLLTPGNSVTSRGRNGGITLEGVLDVRVG